MKDTEDVTAVPTPDEAIVSSSTRRQIRRAAESFDRPRRVSRSENILFSSIITDFEKLLCLRFPKAENFATKIKLDVAVAEFSDSAFDEFLYFRIS